MKTDNKNRNRTSLLKSTYTLKTRHFKVIRGKYRLAIYPFTSKQADAANQALQNRHNELEEPIITKVLPCQTFRLNEENYLDYYYKYPSSIWLLLQKRSV